MPPNLPSNEAAIEVILDAIKTAGYEAGRDVFLALDVAASELYKDKRYHLESNGLVYSSEEMVNFI